MVYVIYLGLVSSVIAYWLMNHSLSKMPATKSTIFANLSTIISIVAGVVVWKKHFITTMLLDQLWF